MLCVLCRAPHKYFFYATFLIIFFLPSPSLSHSLSLSRNASVLLLALDFFSLFSPVLRHPCIFPASSGYLSREEGVQRKNNDHSSPLDRLQVVPWFVFPLRALSLFLAFNHYPISLSLFRPSYWTLPTERQQQHTGTAHQGWRGLATLVRFAPLACHCPRVTFSMRPFSRHHQHAY